MIRYTKLGYRAWGMNEKWVNGQNSFSFFDDFSVWQCLKLHAPLLKIKYDQKIGKKWRRTLFNFPKPHFSKAPPKPETRGLSTWYIITTIIYVKKYIQNIDTIRLLVQYKYVFKGIYDDMVVCIIEFSIICTSSMILKK